MLIMQANSEFQCMIELRLCATSVNLLLSSVCEGYRSLLVSRCGLQIWLCSPQIYQLRWLGLCTGSHLVLTDQQLKLLTCVQTEGEQHHLKYSQFFHLMPHGQSFVVTNGTLRFCHCALLAARSYLDPGIS